ncbi:MAG: hypothetical protein FP811_12870 [Desulfobacteraceae bacterium]|nr:hypothetical protein [Desulfobacteraceae bacterium]
MTRKSINEKLFLASSSHHPIIPSFHHSIIPSFHHSIIPSFHHSIIPCAMQKIEASKLSFAFNKL